MKKEKKKRKVKVCRHKHTDMQDCGACGHIEEYCFGCEKARCPETGNKWVKIY